MYKIETTDLGEKGQKRNYTCTSVNRGDALSRACEIVRIRLGGLPFEYKRLRDGVFQVISGDTVKGTFKLIEL